MLYDPKLESVFGYRGEYYFLSNFYPQMDPVSEIFKGVYIEYPTVEHAYQASKSLDARVRMSIASQTTPGGLSAKAVLFPVALTGNRSKTM